MTRTSKIHEDDEIVVRISEENEDGDVMIYAHRKVGGVEQVPRGYVLGSNCMLLKGVRSNVTLKEEIETESSPFAETDRLRDMFGQRPGTELETRTTYVPTGEIVRVGGYNNVAFLRFSGCRTFPATEFDGMVSWMEQHARRDLIALEIVEKDLLR